MLKPSLAFNGFWLIRYDDFGVYDKLLINATTCGKQLFIMFLFMLNNMLF